MHIITFVYFPISVKYYLLISYSDINKIQNMSDDTDQI